MKEGVEKSLPPKEETILDFTPTLVQNNHYKEIYKNNTSLLFKGAKIVNNPSLMNVMTELRNCCNKLFLIRGSEERISYDAASSGPHKS